MDHKIPWRDENNAKDLFFDLNNVSFSHQKCNSGATRMKGKHPSAYAYKQGCRCSECKQLYSEAKNRYRKSKKIKKFGAQINK